MRRLSGLDAGFLSMETASMHMQVASACIFDPAGVDGGWTFDRVRALVESRLALVPPFRRRLVEVPFQLHHPVWVEDPDFDLDYHLRRAALPSPGGVGELAGFAADVMGRPLDRSRPLWEMYVLEGLEGGRSALVAKTHHAAIDGVSGAELMAQLLDVEPNPGERSSPGEPSRGKPSSGEPPPADPWRPDRVPSDFEMLAYAVSSLALQPAALVVAVDHAVKVGLNLAKRNREPDVRPPPAPFSAPRTSLNQSITPHRRCAFTRLPLDDMRAVRAALGGTVNDVVLAVAAGALRHYLAARGEDPEESLVALVPISVRGEGEEGTLGNRVSAMLVSLATAVADPAERLRVISEGTRQAKAQGRAIGAGTLTDWAELAAPAVAALAARLVSRMKVFDLVRPAFNVVVSNVPGPGFPLYCAGAPMEAIYPMGPVADGAGLNMTVMSYRGTMFFGLVACRETVPALDEVADHLGGALDELVEAARP
ncbi:MAG: WS/DGAT/MGAT family O-acyltransferase [Acidimicrobiales bacterium]